MSILTSDIITELFYSRGWEKKDGNYSLFNRVCATYDSLQSKEEKDLFLRICQNVIDISFIDYEKCTVDLLTKINDYNSKEKTINIAPLKTSNDKVTSSDFVAYLCKSKSIYYNDSFADKSIQVYGSDSDYS